MKRAIAACFAGCAYLAVLVSCDTESPTTADRSQPPRVHLPAVTYVCSTTTQFEAAWNGGNFAAGTEFLIPSGHVLNWTTNKSFNETAARNKSFTIRGQDTTAVLMKSYSGGAPTALFIVLDDSIASPDAIVIENIKLVRAANEGLFIAFTDYASIHIVDVVMDLGDNSNTLRCDELLIEGLSLASESGLALNFMNRAGREFNHIIRNSVLRAAGTNSRVCNSAFSFDGSIEFDENTFLAPAGHEGEEFYDITVAGTLSNPSTVELLMTQNDLGEQALQLSQCHDGHADITFAGNNSSIEFCAEDLVTCISCGPNFTYSTTVLGWSFEGDPFDYDDFGPISGQNACYDATDTVYVEFSLATTAAFEDYQDVEVEWGDDNCTAGGGTVAATWNPTTSMWNAAFDVSGIGDADVYWRGKGTLCSKTVVGDCIRRRFTLCGPGGIPVWFTQE